MTIRTLEQNELLEQAVDWMVTLQSGDVSSEEQQQFSAWLTSSINHNKAWHSIANSVATPVAALQDLPSEQGPFIERALLRDNSLNSDNRRDFLRNSLAFAGITFGLTGLAGLSHRYQPLTGLTADLSTGTAERLTKKLDDSSELILNARTQVNLNVSSVYSIKPLITKTYRTIDLREGEIQLMASQQPQAFNIHCQHGHISVLTANNTSHCLVKINANSTFVLALAGELNIKNQQGQSVKLNAGEAVSFNKQFIYQKQLGLSHKAQWSQGLYLAKNESLHSLMQALADYYPGFIRVSEKAKNIKIYGGYPLDDLDKTFATLAQTLPIKVRKLGSLVTFIDVS